MLFKQLLPENATEDQRALMGLVLGNTTWQSNKKLPIILQNKQFLEGLRACTDYGDVIPQLMKIMIDDLVGKEEKKGKLSETTIGEKCWAWVQFINQEHVKEFKPHIEKIKKIQKSFRDYILKRNNSPDYAKRLQECQYAFKIDPPCALKIDPPSNKVVADFRYFLNNQRSTF